MILGPAFLGAAWERIARASVARLAIAGRRWRPASRWWGPATDRTSMEIDVVAECIDDPQRVLVGEAKLTATVREQRGAAEVLLQKAARCPELAGRNATAVVFAMRAVARAPGVAVLRAEEVVEA
jgi:hypothetical protein